MTLLAWGFLFGGTHGTDDDAAPNTSLHASASLTRATATSNDPDGMLVAAIRNGNRDAFRTLYLAHVSELIGIARRIVPTAADAEDVVQEIFTHIWHQRAEFRPARAMAYLVGAVRKRALERARHARVVHRTEEIGQDLSIAMAHRPLHPDEHTERAELSAALVRVVQHLPERRRTALLLRVVHGMSYRDIAETLQIGETAAHMLVTRTFAALRPLLQRFLDD